TITASVRAAMLRSPECIVLDDAAALAHPMLVRASLQAISTIVDRVPVTLRFGAGPFASANLLTALKSGVKTLQAGDGWVDPGLVTDLARSLDIDVSHGAMP
ncbi:MAG: hypothetical protein ACI867_001902, partial [Glaciecola sp.]